MWMDIKIMYSKLLQRWESFRYLFVVSAVITGTALVSLGQVTVELRNVGHMTASQNDSAGEEHTYYLKLLPNSKRISFMCNITIRKEMDLMKMKSLPFIKRLKNPCWYKGGILQCLPYMFLVGVAKCGTTDLFKRITLHPDFLAPTRKEPNWLSAGRFYRNESFTYYTSTFFSPLSIALSKSESSNLITGEASINTLEGAHFWNHLGNNVGHDEPVENNPEYIYHVNREARILINVRNPVDRLWSEYLAFSKRESKSAERFHEIVLRELRLYRECLQIRSLRSCMYDKTLAKFSTISKEERQNLTKQCNPKPIDIVVLRRGVYHVFIKDYLKVFPRQHVLIQRLEGISADPQRALTQTYKFLGLKIPSKGLMQEILDNDIKNTREPLDKEKGDMFDITRRLLHKFYKPHSEQLAILLNNSKYNYGPRG